MGFIRLLMGPAVKEGRSERSVASCIDGEGREKEEARSPDIGDWKGRKGS